MEVLRYEQFKDELKNYSKDEAVDEVYNQYINYINADNKRILANRESQQLKSTLDNARKVLKEKIEYYEKEVIYYKSLNDSFMLNQIASIPEAYQEILELLGGKE